MADGSDGSVSPDPSVPIGGQYWLLKAKVIAPVPPGKYVRRASLRQHLDGVLERRLTALQAPAGFGKTTVLADVVRDRKDHGFIAAWISLDDDDTPSVFCGYLAYAFEHAGLDLSLLAQHGDGSSSPAVQQLGMLARAIDAHAAPCLLVLDEVDRVPPGTIHLIDLLLRRAPDNLHLAVAFRSAPGLDLASHILDGTAIVLGADHLRFSKADIARFFEGRLSRRALSTIEERTEGWPVALVVHGSTQTADTGSLSPGVAQITENYLDVRLLGDLSAADRTMLRDLAVFDRIEPDLVAEVFGSHDPLARAGALSSLDGLLTAVADDRTALRLHPLLREHCLNVLSAEDPARKRDLHKKAALALARRGRLTPAWRHASATGDGHFVGELIERLGVFRLWLRDGVSRLSSAGRYLTPEIVAAYPRLELLQSVLLQLSSRPDEAKARLEAVGRRTDGFTRDREGGDADALMVDRVFTEAVLAVGTLSPTRVYEWLPEGVAGTEEGERSSAPSRARRTLLCSMLLQRAEFAEGERHGLQVLADSDEDTRVGDIFANLCLGMSAMAQGRIREAGERYGLARRDARRFDRTDSCLVVSSEVLLLELDLERNRKRAFQRRTPDGLGEVRAGWSDVYAAAVAVRAELTFVQDDREAARELLTQAVGDARATGSQSLARHLEALLAYYLVEAGRPDEAGRAWRDRQLPCDIGQLLDLERQTWRTMEALSCARIRLLTEQEEYAAARELADRLCETASDRGLIRTRLRGLALSMVLAHRAGQTEQALARLVEFLRLTRDADYFRSLVRHREVSRILLKELLDGDLDGDMRSAAESALPHIDESPPPVAEIFSLRELEILEQVGRGLRNRDIAVHLGITDEGIRYHLKRIYRKTGTRQRGDAVRYAQSLGVLS